jgi:hypothetical protein
MPDFDANNVKFSWDGPNQLIVLVAGTSRKLSISKN